MPRGGPAGNPRLTTTNASTGTNLGTCLVRDTRCLCATGTAPEYRWGAGTVCATGDSCGPAPRGRTPPTRGFRLWRTSLEVGNADAGVCVVLSCKGRKRSQPDTEAGGTTRRKATLTGA